MEVNIMFETTNLDMLDIENGAMEIRYAVFHFQNFRKEVQEARTYDDSDEYLKPVKRQHVEGAKNQYRYYKNSIRNEFHYLGVCNKDAVNVLIFEYKYKEVVKALAEVPALKLILAK